MKRGSVALNNPARFEGNYEINRQKFENAAAYAADKLSAGIDRYGLKFPENRLDDPSGKKYTWGENNSWVSGLHTGCFLLAYELTGSKKFLDAASEQMETYEKRIETKYRLNDHDVGFVFSPSCVAYYKLTGDSRAKKMSVMAAQQLYDVSYTEKGGFILRQGNRRDEEWACRTMMDTLLNIPLFYWAAKETGDKRFFDAANSQIDITEKYLIRPDGSSYHHYQFETGTLAPLHGVTNQGNRDESTWSRGQAWGVLGLPIAYGYSGNKELNLLHRDVTYYTLNHLPADNLLYWDFDFTEGAEPRDSSANVITACGLMEAASCTEDGSRERGIYKNAAAMLLEAVIDRCSGDIGEEYDGVINKVTGSKPANMCIEGCAPYGDFFYLEALMRYLNPSWKCYW